MQVGNGAADKYGTAAEKTRLVQVAWAMHEWACQPYFTLIVTFLFAPYFAVHVVGDPATGQASWGYAHAAAGLAVAVFNRKSTRLNSSHVKISYAVFC